MAIDRNQQIRALVLAAQISARRARIASRLAAGRLVTLRQQSKHQIAKLRARQGGQ